MLTRRFRTAAGAFLALAACSRSPARSFTELPPSAQALPEVTLLRVPRGGGFAMLHRLPDLTPLRWESSRLPAVRGVVGADLDQQLVFLLDTAGAVLGLDLESGRSRAFLGGVALAAAGPDGSLFAVDTARRVTAVARRAPVPFRAPLPAAARTLVGTHDGALVAILAGGRTVLLDRDQPAAPLAAPAGPVASTTVGDLLAFATDTGIVLYEPGARDPFRTLDPGGKVRAVAFSASGHRLYAATDRDEVVVFDRFTEEEVETIDLPDGGATALRPGMLGAWVLARGSGRDTVYVIDGATNQLAGTVVAPWSTDLPLVGEGHLMVARRGADVVTIDLAKAGFPVAGRVNGRAEDLWFAAPWAPRRRTVPAPAVEPEPAVAAADTATEADSAAGTPDDAVAGEPPVPDIYLQVSSSQNPTWARELADELRDAGFSARVLEPVHPDEGYRVVIGPFTTRDEAEATGRRLGRPYFIFKPREDDTQ